MYGTQFRTSDTEIIFQSSEIVKIEPLTIVKLIPKFIYLLSCEITTTIASIWISFPFSVCNDQSSFIDIRANLIVMNLLQKV